MAVPKRKVSRARRDKRSANKGLKPLPMTYCGEGACKGAPKLPHEVCPVCGFYKGKKVLRTKADRSLSRGEKRQQLAERGKSAGHAHTEQEQ